MEQRTSLTEIIEYIDPGYDDAHGAQNHCFYGCEQCAKMGVRNHILRICVCAHPT